MRSLIRQTIWLFFISVWILSSCKKEYSCESCNLQNKPPVSIAGPDQLTFLPKDSVLLNGSQSYDTDGTIIQYQWIKISGPANYSIVTGDSSKTLVKGLSLGIYLFELNVKDDKNAISKDTVQILVNSVTVNPLPPVAKAGPDQTISSPVDSTLLDGSLSFDPDGMIVSYLWTKISGPASNNIANINAAQTKVYGLSQGNYKFELRVTDNMGLVGKDTVQVIVINPTTANLTIIGHLSEARDNIAVASAGSKIVFAGGLKAWVCGPDYGVPSSAVDIYDINTQTWTTAQLSVARWGIAAIALGNKLFFAGGENGQWTTYDNVDIYDVSTNTWTVAHLSEARGFTGAAKSGNKIFFAGGYYYPAPITPSNRVDVYDISTNTWSIHTLPNAKTGICGISTVDKAYLGGGWNYTNSTNTIDIYNNTSGTWSVASYQLLYGVYSGARYGDNNYWTSKTQPTVEIQNTSTNSVTVESLTNIRGATLVRNDEIVFLGGNSFDIYNTTSSSWTTKALPQSISPFGMISVNNIIYKSGNYYMDSNNCPVFTNEVYKISW